METIQSIKLLQEQIYQILKDNPETRNSDKLLTWKVWQHYYEINDYLTLKSYMNLPAEESISRCRRKIQETKFPPTNKEIALSRGWLELDWKYAMGYIYKDSKQLEMI